MSSRLSPHSSEFTDNPLPWSIIPWGDSLTACTLAKESEEPRIICVIDIGSNSLKQAIFDRQRNSLEPLDEKDVIAALAAGMKPNDKHAVLSEQGLNILFNEALPKFLDRHKKFKVDTVVVVCTEAMRSAHLSDPVTVDAICQCIADKLKIPVQAINLVNNDTEARLAARAALVENSCDEFVMMQGGGSTEIARNPYGVSAQNFRKTLHFGTRTLGQQEDVARFLHQEFSGVDWFKPLTSPSAGHFSATDNRYGSLCLLGGAFRPLGRLLCQRINNIPFYATASYGGRRLLWTEELHDHLRSLTLATPDQLQRELIEWGNPETREMNQAKLAAWIDKHYDKWIETPIRNMGAMKPKALTIGEVWHEKIARRAGGIPCAALTVLAAVEAARPHELVFGNGNIREAVFIEPKQ